MGDFGARFGLEVDLQPALDLDVVDGEDKVVPPVAPAEIAISNGMQADTFLQGDDVAHRLRFHFPKRRVVDLALVAPCAGLDQALGAKKTANVVGAERRLGSGSHGVPVNFQWPRRQSFSPFL